MADEQNIIDLSNVPGVVTIYNKGTKRVTINIPGVNQSFPLDAGQTVKLKAETTAELIGYLSQENAELGIDVELPEASI